MRRRPHIPPLPEPLHAFIYEPPVTPTIWPRRLFHLLAGSTIPLLILLAPEHWVEWVLIGGAVSSVLIEAGRSLVGPLNDLIVSRLPFFKPKERLQVTGATFLWLSATFVYFVFPHEAAVLALLFLAVGDPVAALVGGRDHTIRVFGKSPTGTVAFAVAATLAGVLVSIHPDVRLGWWIPLGAVAAAIAELVPSPVDDNLTVPLAAALVMAVPILL